MNNADKELAESKKAKAVAEEAKAEAEGELERSNKGVADNSQSLKDLQHECMTTAEAYEQESKERSDELGALAAAKKILEEKTGGAAERTYSFMQAKSQLRSKAQLRVLAAGDKVVAMIQQLGRAEKQQSLAQLASRVRSELATDADPFAKVKGMIQEMVEKLTESIATLEAEIAETAAAQKAADEMRAEQKS